MVKKGKMVDVDVVKSVRGNKRRSELIRGGGWIFRGMRWVKVGRG